MKYCAFGEEVHNGEGLLCTAISEEKAREIAEAMNKAAEEKERNLFCVHEWEPVLNGRSVCTKCGVQAPR